MGETMNRTRVPFGAPCLLAGLLLPAIAAAADSKVVFQTPHLGSNLGVWRLTHDPVFRHHANYHNTQCWSPDGRYVCYTCYGGENPGSESTSTVHVYDTQADTTLLVGQGESPRWAKHHNWLFYVDYSRSQRRARTSDVVWVDMASGKRVIIAPGPGPEALGETDGEDRWLYGALRFRGHTPEFQVIRIAIGARGGHQKLPAVAGSQLLPNPRYPVFFTRQDHKNDPFAATRWWYDLDGSNQRIGVPTIQQCHMCWLGNGEFMLLGNGLIRGRRWNEPFPSNIHILAAIGVGDVSPCGTSGRYVCGDHNVADLRSGGGFTYIDPLSIVCYPKSVGDASGIYDADPKGSPDGTKICFVSNYDLRDGPAAKIAEDTPARAERLAVTSTAGFPEQGSLNVNREVIGYERKTPTSFEGLRRGLHGTVQVPLRAGRAVTSFDARCLSEAAWKRMGKAPPTMSKLIEAGSPLLRQRQTDVYVAVVRSPDRPWLQAAEGNLQLVPGEHHAETAGYRLLRDGQPAPRLIAPGAEVALEQPGQYQAVAVEHSGLESDPSVAVRITTPVRLAVLRIPPRDFSWTSERMAGPVNEIVHRYDGIIRREWRQGGTIAKAHDLDSQGRAIRRVEYRGGRMSLREYFTADNVRVSRELFDPAGFVTETVRYGADGTSESDHWWFERGMPVKQIHGTKTYVKRGDRFGRIEGDKFIDTPRGATSD